MLVVLVVFAMINCEDGQGYSPSEGLPDNVEDLARALGNARFLPVRLVGGFEHGACGQEGRQKTLLPSPTCEPQPQPTTSQLKKLRKIARRLAFQRNDLATEASEPRAGVAWDLLLGKESATARAIETLERLSTEQPEAFLYNDLGVAYFKQAHEHQNPFFLLRSLRAFDRAVSLPGDLEEARFNLALTLERLYLYEAAKAAWLDYLEIDPSSPWAVEARAHLSALETDLDAIQSHSEWVVEDRVLRLFEDQDPERTVEQYTKTAREFAERELLGHWAQQLSGGENDLATRSLNLARRIADAVYRYSGDRMALDAIRSIDRALARNDKETILHLIRGHREFLLGYHKYRHAKTDEALAHLLTAEAALRRGQSPFALWARFFYACSIFQSDRFDEALGILARLEPSASDPYLSLLGHIQWMIAQVHSQSGRPLASVEPFRRAVKTFEVLGETENAITMRSLLANSLEYLGRTTDAWRLFYQTLRDARYLIDPKRLDVVFSGLSQAAIKSDFLRVATYFQQEACRNSSRTGNAALQANAYFWSAFLRGMVDGQAAGIDDLRRASEALDHIPADEPSRLRMEAKIAVLQGYWLSKSESEASLDHLEKAIGFYEDRGLGVESAVMAYKERARRWLDIGDERSARADLSSALRIYERRLEQGRREDVRWSLVERAQELYDEIFGIALRQGKVEEAFRIAERAKNKGLPSFLSTGFERLDKPLVSLGPEEIRLRLPVETSLVHYVLIDETVHCWLLQPGRIEYFTRPFPQRLRRFLQHLPRDVGRLADSDPLAEEFSRALLSPWLDLVPAGDLIVFVTDKELGGVPFAALRHPATGDYLVESNRLVVSPSGSIFTAMAAHRGDPNAATSALVVGDPAFNSRDFPDLGKLSYAEEGAREIDHLYPESTLLLGPAASSPTFVDLAPRATVVHFGGHAIANDRDPLYSMLVLARSTGDASTGALYAHEVHRLDLSSVRVVMLSACEAARTTGYPGEGLSSLGRAFLAAGASSVVASLWKVDDQAASHLAQEFHRALSTGADPSAALQRAQLALLQHEDSTFRDLRQWAAFRVIGANVSLDSIER